MNNPPMRLRNIIQQLLFLLAMSFASCTSDLDLRGEALGKRLAELMP